jgi:Virulence factor membrane-bound polymerase, C-terminal/O-Antigen ligase
MFGKPSTMLWPSMAAISVAATWILPNHHLPWRVFHQDAWMFLCALCMGLWVLWKCGTNHVWSFSAILIVTSALIPLVQWRSGLVATSGQAVISMAYILGLGLATVIGQQAQRKYGDLLLHILFSGIAIACLANVGIQLFQWFALYDENFLSFIGFLITPISISTRPSGNILQPNQLATMLVWGLIAGYWAYLQRIVHLWILVLYLVFVGFGLALTQSRIGLIEVMSLFIACWYWRRLLPDAKVVYACLMLVAFITAMYFTLPYMSNWLGLEYIGRDHGNLAQDSVRLVGYRIYIDALFEHPWFGYGISHLGNAYFELVQTQTPQSVYFLHTHNIFLDLLLWLGIPMGLLVIGGLLWWLISIMNRLANAQQVLLFMAVSTLGMHSLVELPHQFSYFLIPAGIFLGSLNHLAKPHCYWLISRWLLGIFVFIGGILWSAILHDYLLAEEHYAELRFEQQHVGRPLGNPVPSLLVLNQLEYMMQMERLKAVPNMSGERLAWMNSAVRGEVSGTAYFVYICSLALNGHQQEAIVWMHRLNAMSTKSGLRTIRVKWKELQNQYPQINDLEWVSPNPVTQNL